MYQRAGHRSPSSSSAFSGREEDGVPVKRGFPNLGFSFGVFHDYEGFQPPWVVGKLWRRTDDESSSGVNWYSGPDGSSEGPEVDELKRMVEELAQQRHRVRPRVGAMSTPRLVLIVTVWTIALGCYRPRAQNCVLHCGEENACPDGAICSNGLCTAEPNGTCDVAGPELPLCLACPPESRSTVRCRGNIVVRCDAEGASEESICGGDTPVCLDGACAACCREARAAARAVSKPAAPREPGKCRRRARHVRRRRVASWRPGWTPRSARRWRAGR